MTKEEQLYFTIGLSISDAEQSKMFGKPCYKIGGKAFCCFFQNEMVFKLPGEFHAEALSLDGAQLFDPSGKGRAMKEWVQVPYDYSANWNKYACLAMEYVRSK